MMNRTQKTSRRPLMTYSDQKRGEGRGAVSSRVFDLLNSMIYDPVLHSPLDDLVNWIEPKEDVEGQKVFCYILMDQICALMVKVVNCIGC